MSLLLVHLSSAIHRSVALGYTVADYGFEDDTAWLLVEDGSKLVIEGGYSCEPVVQGSTFVDKRTEEVFLTDFGRAMT